MDDEDEWADNWASRTNSEIAAAWIDYQARSHPADEEAGDDKDWWAVDAMMSFLDSDPLKALEITFLIARSSTDDTVLEMLGAAPLEDLLSDDPTLFDAVALEAKANPNLRLALRSVWQSTIPDAVWAAIQRLAAE